MPKPAVDIDDCPPRIMHGAHPLSGTDYDPSQDEYEWEDWCRSIEDWNRSRDRDAALQARYEPEGTP